MKRLILQAFLLINCLAAFGQQDSLRITGKLKGQGNAKLSVSFINNDGKNEHYTCTAINNVFYFHVKKQSQPVVAQLSTSIPRSLSKTINGINYGNPAPNLNFFIYQSDLAVKGTAADINLASVHGDKENNEFEKYKSSVRKIEKENWEIQKQQFKLDNVNDSTLIHKLSAKMSPNFSKTQKISKEFIQNNPASFTSIFLLSRSEPLYTNDNYASIFERLPAYYKKTKLAQDIAKRIKTLSVTAKGVQAINFSRTTNQGNPFSLTDLKGKVVLLDFWGSWCGPCRASMPHLKELYAKYKSKGFEIVGIASERGKTLDENKATWNKAIKEEGLEWINVLNNENAEQMNIVREYHVNGFPTKILLDENGKVLLRVIASATDDLDRQLKKIYGE